MKTERGKDWFEIGGLFADCKRCSQAILDVLATTDVGRRVLQPVEEDAQSEASQWDLRGRNEGRRSRRTGPDSGYKLAIL